MGEDGARGKDWLRAPGHHLCLTDTIFLFVFFLIVGLNCPPLPLEVSISSFREFLWVFSFLLYFAQKFLFENIVDPDQTSSRRDVMFTYVPKTGFRSQEDYPTVKTLNICAVSNFRGLLKITYRRMLNFALIIYHRSR